MPSPEEPCCCCEQRRKLFTRFSQGAHTSVGASDFGRILVRWSANHACKKVGAICHAHRPGASRLSPKAIRCGRPQRKPQPQETSAGGNLKCPRRQESVCGVGG